MTSSLLYMAVKKIKFLSMAVSNVHFKCNDTWYVQKEGLAMGASLAVILANLWLKYYEKVLTRNFPEKMIS